MNAEGVALVRVRSLRRHPGPGRPREQPQERLRRHSPAEDHRVHRGLGVLEGEVVARVRHDRRRSPSASLNETFSTFVQNFLPRYGQPDVDVLANLSTAIIIDQQPIGGNPRSTLGTATDIYTLLRVVFSRLGKPTVPHALALSFNSPGGMCPECEGLGRMSRIDLDALVDKNKSLEGGAILFPPFYVGVATTWPTPFAKSGSLRPQEAAQEVHERRVEQVSSPRRREDQGQRGGKDEVALRRPHREVQAPLPGQGRGGDGAAPSPVVRADREPRTLHRVRRDAPVGGSARLPRRRQEHRRVLGDAGERPRRVSFTRSARRTSLRCSRACPRGSIISSRSGSAI